MRKDRASARRRCRQLAALLFCLCAGFAPGLHAVEVESLYTADVPVDPADPESRETAYQRALQQVLVRITGTEDAAFSPELQALFPDPSRYVLQFRPAEEGRLSVTFDGAALEAVLKGNALPVWDKDRPLTLVWLAVDWGQGDRELVGRAAGDAVPSAFDLRAARREELRRRVERVATARGLPVAFPAQDAIDAISFTDAWGGFHERLKALSREAGAMSVLVGRLRPGVAERNRWSWYFGDEERTWSGEPEDAIHLLADTLAARFAFSGNAPAEAVSLEVLNGTDVRDYVAIERLIGGLGMIESYRIAAVEGDRIRYSVRINGGPERLASALEREGRLEREAVDPNSLELRAPDALRYVYVP